MVQQEISLACRRHTEKKNLAETNYGQNPWAQFIQDQRQPTSKVFPENLVLCEKLPNIFV